MDIPFVRFACYPLGFIAYKMKLFNPLQGSILKRYPTGSILQFYGEHPDLYKKYAKLAFHPGIDIYMPKGTPVLAATDGKVVETKHDPYGYGKHIRIVSSKMDGFYYETIYGHLDEIKVAEKQMVKAGEIIGLEGNTGFVISGGTIYWGDAPGNLGVHIHFGARLLEDAKPDTAQIHYHSGDSYTLLSYNNGVYGYIDPLPMMLSEATNLTTMFTLIKQSQDAKEIWAIIDNKRFWVIDPITFEQGRKILWAGWEEIMIENPANYEYAGALILVSPDDPNI